MYIWDFGHNLRNTGAFSLDITNLPVKFQDPLLVQRIRLPLEKFQGNSTFFLLKHEISKEFNQIQGGKTETPENKNKKSKLWSKVQNHSNQISKEKKELFFSTKIHLKIFGIWFIYECIALLCCIYVTHSSDLQNNRKLIRKIENISSC